MWKPRQARRLPALSALIAGSALALAIPALTTTASAATGAAARPRPVLRHAYGGGVQPNKLGELDCRRRALGTSSRSSPWRRCPGGACGSSAT